MKNKAINTGFGKTMKVNAEEYELVRRAAEIEERAMSNFCRRATLAEARRVLAEQKAKYQ